MATMNYDRRLLTSNNVLMEPKLAVIMLGTILVSLASLPKHTAVQAQADSAFHNSTRSDQGQRLEEVLVSKGAEMNDAKNSGERMLNRIKRKRGTHHRGANKRKKQSGVVKKKKRTVRKKRHGGIYDTGGKPMGPSGWWQAPPAWSSTVSWQATQSSNAWSSTGSWQATPSSNGDSIGRGTCGGGSIGNNICPNNNDCCSEFGFCGTSAEYCTTKVGDFSSKDDSTRTNNVENSGPTTMTYSKSGKASKTGKAGKIGKIGKSSDSLQAQPVLGSTEAPQLGSTEAPPVLGSTEAPQLGSTEAPPVLGSTETPQLGSTEAPPVLGSTEAPQLGSTEAPPVWSGSTDMPTGWDVTEAPPVWSGSTDMPPVWGGTEAPPAWGGGWVYPSPPYIPQHIKCGKWGSSSYYWGGWYDPCIATHTPTYFPTYIPEPTYYPTTSASSETSSMPSSIPSSTTPAPTYEPTPEPSLEPTILPTMMPTILPTLSTLLPTSEPTFFDIARANNAANVDTNIFGKYARANNAAYVGTNIFGK
ncbi:hypothetical protein ACHAXA_011246, partial [Cyclostephanos tholiformis]